MKSIKLYIAILTLFTASGQLFAQSRASAFLPVRINIISGINMSTLQGDLNFGEIIVTEVSSAVTKSPKNGVLLEIEGQPNREIYVEYSQSYLSPVKEEAGGNSLVFLPSVEATESSVYNSSNTLNNGDPLKLDNKNGKGKHYLWVGGKIELPNTVQSGDYNGDFVITVSY